MRFGLHTPVNTRGIAIVAKMLTRSGVTFELARNAGFASTCSAARSRFAVQVARRTSQASCPTQEQSTFQAVATLSTRAYVFLMTRETLSREDWLLAGFKALAANGPEALKAERLARALGTTKGSFYWHFTDVPTFREAMLDHWRDRALTGIIAEIETEQTPASALRKLAQIAARGADNPAADTRMEPAVRAWARSDQLVAETLASIDAERLRFMENLLRRCGVPNPDLARALYAASIGMEDLSSRDGAHNDEAMGTLVDLILALR